MEELLSRSPCSPLFPALCTIILITKYELFPCSLHHYFNYELRITNYELFPCSLHHYFNYELRITNYELNSLPERYALLLSLIGSEN